jgi:hypothetical protein
LKGAALRVLDKFALVYAAARLARNFDILPIRRPGPAVLSIYRRHVAQRDQTRRSTNNGDALRKVQDYFHRHREHFYDLSHGYPKLSGEEFKTAPGFVLRKGGSTWLLVSAARWSATFPANAKQLLVGLQDAGKLKATEGFQWQTKVRKSEKKDRVYAIKLD